VSPPPLHQPYCWGAVPGRLVLAGGGLVLPAAPGRLGSFVL
jgi:hypothetical protein